MKKVTALSVVMLVLSASLAMAQSGINLYVGDCAAGAPSNTVTNLCTSNTGSFNIVGSCVLPEAIADFVSAGAVVDVQTDAATLPDWWRADAAGCRSGAITMGMDGTVSPNCATVWDGQANVTPLFAAMVTDPTRIGNEVPVNRIRLNGIAALTSAASLSNTTDELGVVRFTITRTKTTGAGACTGCTAGACLVLNEIMFFHEAPGVAPLRITNGLANRMVTYNPSSLSLVCPDAVPVRNRTWGAIKSLYR